MADNVRYILEKMAPLFRRMEEVELFSKDEIKTIVKKRTDFEYVLKRRQLRTEDFSTYLSYELALDKLRMARAHRIGTDKPREVISLLSSIQASFIRHITYIYERAVRRFPYNMQFWSDFISYLQQRKSIAILNTVFGRVLSLFPKQEEFWVKAAVHELELNNNTHAARVILQRALRVNTSSASLWQRYFELELWNSAKIIERERLLAAKTPDSEFNAEDTLSGAPLVVFKYALGALTKVDEVVDLYLSCEGISSVLSLAMEKEIRRKHGHHTALWAALVDIHLKRTLYGYASGASKMGGTELLAALQEKAESVKAVLTSSAVALRECGDMISEAAALCGADSSTSADFALFVSRTVCKSVESVSAFLGGTMRSDRVRESLTGAAATAAVGLDAELNKLRMAAEAVEKVLSTYCAPAADGGDISASRNQGVLLWTRHCLLLLRLSLGLQNHQSEEKRGRSDSTVSTSSRASSASGKRSSRKRKGNEDVGSVNSSSNIILSASSLLQALSESAAEVLSWVGSAGAMIAQSQATSASLKNSSLVQQQQRLALMDTYCFVVDKALQYARRMVLVEAVENSDSRDRSLAELVLLTIGQSLRQSAVALLRAEIPLKLRWSNKHSRIQGISSAEGSSSSTHSGSGTSDTVCLCSAAPSEILKKAVHFSAEMRSYSDGEFGSMSTELLEAVIADTGAECIEKGEWCALYIHTLVNTSSYSVKGLHSGSDSNSGSTMSVLDRVREGYRFVCSARHRAPHSFALSSMEAFFTAVLQMETLAAHSATAAARAPTTGAAVKSSSSSTGHALQGLLDVAMEAVRSCPNETDFWDILEDTYGKIGDVAAAGRAKWERKQHQLQTK